MTLGGGVYLQTLGGVPHLLNYYDRTVVSTNFTGPYSTGIAFNCVLTCIGNVVTWELAVNATGTMAVAGQAITASAFPARFCPNATHSYFCFGVNGPTAFNQCRADVMPNGTIIFYASLNSGAFGSSGVGGIYPSSFVWSL